MAADPGPKPLPEIAAGRPVAPAQPTPLGSYPRAIRAHPFAVLLVILAAVGASVAYIKGSTPDYQARATVIVNPVAEQSLPFLDAPIVRNTGDPVRTIQTAAGLMDSHEAATLAATRLGGGWTAQTVRDSTDVSPEGQSSLVAITGHAASPRLAARLTSVFVDAVFSVRRQQLQRVARPALRDTEAELARLRDANSPTAVELQGQASQLRAIRRGVDPNLSRVEAAAETGDRLGPPSWLVVGLALIAGLVVAAGLALVLESFGAGLVTSENQLLSVYPLPILARVGKLPRWRHRSASGPWHVDERVREAFRTVRVQLELTTPRPRAITITSATRGDGKTFAATHLAKALAATGTQVILVDAELRRPNLRRALGMDEKPEPAQPMPSPLLRPINELLEQVPSEPRIRLLELDRVSVSESAEALANTMTTLVQRAIHLADIVIIDTPPLGEVSDGLTLMGSVDELLLIARLRNTRQTSLEVMRDLLQRSGVVPGGYIVMGSTEAIPSYGYRERSQVERAAR